MKHLAQFALILILWSCSSEEESSSPEVAEKETPEEEVDQLRYDDMLFFLFDDPAQSNTFREGEMMNVMITNVRGLVPKNDYFDLGMSMKVVNSRDSLIIEIPDIMEIQPVKFPSPEQVDLSFYINFFRPYEKGNTYLLTVHVWDKNGDKDLTLTREFKVEESLPNGFVQVESNGIDVNRIITYRDGRPYSGNIFEQEDRLFMNVELKQAFLNTSPPVNTTLRVTDANGKEILFSKESATLGPDSQPFNNFAVFTAEEYPVGKYTFELVVDQPNSGDQLKISYPLEIVEGEFE